MFRKCLVLSVVPVHFICFTVGEGETFYRFPFVLTIILLELELELELDYFLPLHQFPSFSLSPFVAKPEARISRSESRLRSYYAVHSSVALFIS